MTLRLRAAALAKVAALITMYRGQRRALCARVMALARSSRQRDIRCQFLTEATTLCILGGLIGIPLRRGRSWCVAWLANWPIFLRADAALFAVAFAAAFGISFGYPRAEARVAYPLPVLSVFVGVLVICTLPWSRFAGASCGLRTAPGARPLCS